MEKPYRKLHQKLAPDPFLILLNNPKQPLDARNALKQDVLKEDYQQALKKLTLFFLMTNCSSDDEASSKTLLYSLHIIRPRFMM